MKLEVDIFIPPKYELMIELVHYFDEPEMIDFYTLEQLEDMYHEVQYYKYV
jgi:hypothetical protein